jgi:hypothetical protein
MKNNNNYVNGIMLMVGSAMLTFIFMLMINWNSNLSLMHNLSIGTIFNIEDYHGECGRYVTKRCGDLMIYFKYAAIVPLSFFLFGLYSFLRSEKKNAESSENAKQNAELA